LSWWRVNLKENLLQFKRKRLRISTTGSLYRIDKYEHFSGYQTAY